MSNAQNAQNVMILGGHGKVALKAAPQIVEAGHTVTSVVRNPDHVADVEATGAQAVVQDIEQLDVAGFEKLFADQDVIIWSAGVGGGDDARTLRVDRDAAIRSIDVRAPSVTSWSATSTPAQTTVCRRITPCSPTARPRQRQTTTCAHLQLSGPSSARLP